VLIFLVIVLGFLHHLWVQILVGRRTKELQQINKELLHQQQQLEHAQRVAILGELSSDLAHELKQPLAAINSYAEGGAIRIDQASDGHDIIGLLGRISTQAQRGAKIIERIRRFAKKGEIKRQRVNLNTLITETISLLDYELKKHKVTPELALPKQAVVVSVDPVEIQQLVVNLVRNSLDAMADNTRPPRLIIRIERQKKERIMISVEDNGHGLGEHDPETLFKPFYSTKPNGMGLGMAICRRIVEAHNGTLQMQPAEPRGTRVICHITGA
jgi:two-component system sensor histidine kinase TtrS